HGAFNICGMSNSAPFRNDFATPDSFPPARGEFLESTAQLLEFLRETGRSAGAIASDSTGEEKGFPIRLTRYYAGLIDWNDPEDPLRKMVWPHPLERVSKAYELRDPIGDAPHSPGPGLIHRYPDRCLLLTPYGCAVHCRFCFRRNRLAEPAAPMEAWLGYLRRHTEIREAIFSGADPLMMPEGELRRTILEFKTIPHLKRFRFHTRVPIVAPYRMTDSRVETLALAAPCVVALHINHPREWTTEARGAVGRLREAGIRLLSQTVLLKGVNDAAPILADLFCALSAEGVRPYYLHHLDWAAGTDRFRISIERGLALFRELNDRLGEDVCPDYVVDLPGGFGKVPVMRLERLSGSRYRAPLPGGGSDYFDPAGAAEALEPPL
ncbi:MAG: KamA family radical SAM protein, partial [Kiritimatiellia bacterium]|nr:KamA family radical SAM protein [Kiritimatiellia bacterium]